ncbi:MAG: acetyl-CoA carboxylase biotin carboxyl carrier protein subunit [Anditalea sp.]
MYSVTINKKQFTVEKAGENFLVNEAPILWDLEKINERTFLIIRNYTSHLVELINIDPKEKTLTIKLNNKISEVKIKDRFDLLLEKLGMNASGMSQIKDIKAPMPGLILDIQVKVGDVIKMGDPVLVLEAMKMENIIKSPGEGEVKAILVGIGSGVEKSQVLIQF